MKKIIIILSSLFMLSALLFLCLYRGKDITVHEIINNCSEIKQSLFFVENDIYYAELSSGVREIDFEYNGISSSKVDYLIVKVILKYEENKQSLKCNIMFDETNCNVVLDKNPFDNSFMIDIQEKLLTDNIRICVEDSELLFFKHISNSFNIDYTKALEIATEQLNKSLNKIGVNDLKGECYLKIAYSYKNERVFFWTFVVKFINHKSVSFAIDVNNGEIVFINYFR